MGFRSIEAKFSHQKASEILNWTAPSYKYQLVVRTQYQANNSVSWPPPPGKPRGTKYHGKRLNNTQYLVRRFPTKELCTSCRKYFLADSTQISSFHFIVLTSTFSACGICQTGLLIAPEEYSSPKASSDPGTIYFWYYQQHWQWVDFGEFEC